eukprot:TRINITY_DN30862_c0_g2_i1.p2 TRINITY_DN30862_c0_g2~~TRINITY_DN30862_c0_g2_i1.p2  ORF type:complete len:298 (+),score=57.54 TRINITY_DN30862_c0_g2_i1:198-1091(+)
MSSQGEYRDVGDFNARLAACVEAAQQEKLVVIADFDRTITRCFLPDGGRGSSAHGVLSAAKVFSDKFNTREKQLFDKYYPIEIDATMPIEEKIPIMSEWYGTVHGLVVEEDITRERLQEAVASCKTIQLRDGAVSFLQECQKADPPIPVLIMSAGLADVIEIFLSRQLPGGLAPTTHVVSNRMNFDETGKVCSFSEPLLHMFNKSARVLPEESRKLVDGKTACLLLGDGVGDATMADGLDLKLLRVGFLNEKVEDRLPQFLDVFDLVIPNDGAVPSACFQAIGAADMAPVPDVAQGA